MSAGLRRGGLAALAAALVLGGCGGDDDGSAMTGGTAATGGSAPEAIEIADFAYAPETITVPAGTELRWTNDDGAPHTATADDGSFDLGEVAGGETSDPVTAPEEPGSYPFHCEIHASMTATLTVEG